MQATAHYADTLPPETIAELNQDHVHAHELFERQALLAQLPHLHIPDREKERIRHCGDNAWLQRSPSTGKFRVAANTCRSRLCPRCRGRAAALTRDRLTAALRANRDATWRMLTLTLRSSSGDLDSQLHNLTTSFRRLRQSSWWKNRVHGGYAVIELTRNAETHLWHPHVHILATGTFLQKQELSDQWRRASRGSFIVDVKLIRQPEQAAHYVAKYLGKPTLAILDAPSNVLNEYVRLTRKHRMFIKFGDAKALPPKSEIWIDPGDWEPYAPLHRVLMDARDGRQYALRILSSLEVHDDGDDQIDPDGS